jgi:hypothetical protein
MALWVVGLRLAARPLKGNCTAIQTQLARQDHHRSNCLGMTVENTCASILARLDPTRNDYNLLPCRVTTSGLPTHSPPTARSSAAHPFQTMEKIGPRMPLRQEPFGSGPGRLDGHGRDSNPHWIGTISDYRLTHPVLPFKLPCP